MKVLLVIDVIGFGVYWFNYLVLLGKVMDYQKSGHNMRKKHLSVLTKILNEIKFVLFSFIPIANLIVGFLFANKVITNSVIMGLFED